MSTHFPAPKRGSLIARLDAVHDHYAEAINYAVAEGNDARVADLAAAYDDESTRVVAEHEGKSHLLPLVPRVEPKRQRRRWRRRSADQAKATA
jgi:hypothetical protein